MSASQIPPWPGKTPDKVRPFRRRGSLVAGVVVSLIAAAVAVGFATRDGGPFKDAFGDDGPGKPGVVEQGGVARGGVAGQEDTVADLLQRRASALVAKDRSEFLATVDPQDAELRQDQARWFDNLTEVPLAAWTYRMAPREDARLPAAAVAEAVTAGLDSFGSFVDVALRITGYDNADSTHDEVYVFTPREGRWYVSGRWVAPGRGNQQLWDVGKVNALRSDHALVLGLPEDDELEPIADEVDASVLRVDEVWGKAWPRKVLVLVTRTEDEMADLLGGKASAYAQLAAITRGELGVAEETAAAERVVINPRAYADLSEVGKRVIMTHEVTHVAVRSATQEWTPMWLAEGFADYIGYQGSGLAVRFIAQELVEDLRGGMEITALPSDADFKTTNARLPQAYEMAWLACSMIAEEHGEAKLLAFVRQAGAPGGSAASVERAFAAVLGTTLAQFTADWREYLDETLS
ncbi:hypothetical protein [Sporichthya sp.]|uniref:hypothetical protein n=1 Tax=Sporichthya sp. TaxID=65475 RepID=UPI0017DCA487|nr:hypothetical protein [Sporichthya sp.]MBA3744703.1 hypothetical protein [Sporichthya sp.]